LSFFDECSLIFTTKKQRTHSSQSFLTNVVWFLPRRNKGHRFTKLFDEYSLVLSKEIIFNLLIENYEITKQYLNDLTYQVLGAAIEVHKEMGSALTEPTYHKCMAREFYIRGIKYESERQVHVEYKGLKLKDPLRCDFLVEDILVVELKAVSAILPIHEAQVISYIELLKKPKGILINFHVRNITSEGVKTFVNKYFSELPDV